MKPLTVPELLPEDSHAWAVVTFCAEMKHFQLGSRLFAASLYADRRDAELMLCLLSSREEIRRPHPEFDAYWWVAFREDLERIAAEPDL